VVGVFGSHRLAWGSNFPASEGKLKQNLDNAKNALACLSSEDQEWIFGKTAQQLYPSLA
jgi:predicted TIM-barrel fold metal-dependent hydrolase